MGRHKKYQRGIETICVCFEKEILELLREHAKSHKISLSGHINGICKNFALNDIEYARVMAKRHNRDFQYWMSEIERIKKEKEIE
jgi:hypothetical protein